MVFNQSTNQSCVVFTGMVQSLVVVKAECGCQMWIVQVRRAVWMSVVTLDGVPTPAPCVDITMLMLESSAIDQVNIIKIQI